VIRISVSGGPKVRAELIRQTSRYKRAMDVALYQMGFDIMARTIPITPVEVGRLRNSQYVTPPRGLTRYVEVGFGVDYAVPVHERPARHKAPTQSKFLEKTISAMRASYMMKLAKLTRAAYAADTRIGAVSGDAPPRPRFTRDDAIKRREARRKRREAGRE
jgi:hypothetical protein